MILYNVGWQIQSLWHFCLTKFRIYLVLNLLQIISPRNTTRYKYMVYLGHAPLKPSQQILDQYVNWKALIDQHQSVKMIKTQGRRKSSDAAVVRTPGINSIFANLMQVTATSIKSNQEYKIRTLSEEHQQRPKAPHQTSTTLAPPNERIIFQSNPHMKRYNNVQFLSVSCKPVLQF